MTTSITTSTETDLATRPGTSLLPWISRGLEGLWLLAVFLVPLIFLDQEYAISEAVIGYIEVPKVALLRTLAGLIALLWLSERAIIGQTFRGSFPTISINTLAGELRPSKVVSSLTAWLKVHPTRWFLLAAGLFFGSTFLSTALSGSFNNSIWGEIPGQDGYSAYTIASYGVLFGAIATHLNTRAQLGRLLAAAVLMGILVGLYGTLQHYGHDFLGLTESTGGGSTRVTIFMGNTIFAGAVLAMTIPITLLAAAINFNDENCGNQGPLSKLGQLGRDSVFTILWAAILAVQFLGIMFTFSRSPWSGTALALVVLVGLVALSLGWRMLIRTGLVLALTGVFSVALLHWQGSVSIISVGPWFGFMLAVLGIAGIFAVLFIIKKFASAAIFFAAVGAAITIIGAALLLPSALSDRGGASPATASAEGASVAGQVGERISSIKTEVLGGFVGGRGTHWEVSWDLIKERPWFEFDDIHLSWLRHLIGYGPDLYRYTYLLKSPAEGVNFLPLEPDHAHNFFIHQTVEQGIFGGLASLGLFVSVFGVVGHQLLFRRKRGSPVYRLLLIGLMAIILGRFLEMMVGVARISDLTVLWVIFGLFAASARFDDGRQEEASPAAAQSPKQPGRRESRVERRRASKASAARSFSTGLIFRLAIVACLAGGIGVVTWEKSINSVRASVAEGQALEHFQNGDLESTLEGLDKAIKLAPGVPIYHNNRAQVYLTYQLRPDAFTDPGCDHQTEIPYSVCLGIQSLESNLDSVNQQPFYYRNRLAAGNSAFNLSLNETAMQFYANASNMVPNAWGIRHELAESMIDVGLYEEALAELDQSLLITGETEPSTRAFFLKGRALKEIGRLDDAIASLKHGISVRGAGEPAKASLSLLRDINDERGVSLDIGYFDAAIDENPQDPAAIYLRGLAHFTLGNIETAILDFDMSYTLGLRLAEVRAHQAYSLLKSDNLNAVAEAAQRANALHAIVQSDPANALLHTYYAAFQVLLRNNALALDSLEQATLLDPDLGLAHLVRGKLFLSSGLNDSAKEVFENSEGLSLPTAQDYADRGEIYAFFGEFELAFSDLDQAIRINPNRAKSYNARARAYATFSDFPSAIADFDAAIRIDSMSAEYLINRGVVYDILRETERSLADFEAAQSLGEVVIPPPYFRKSSYFAAYAES